MAVNDTDGIKTITLDVQQYVVSALINEGYKGIPLKVDVQYRAEYMAWHLAAMMKIPAQVLQQDRVIAEYPSDWWQGIRKRLGLKYNKCQVRLTEHLLYPHVEVPKYHGDKVRLHVYTPPTRFMSYKEIDEDDEFY